MNNKTLVIDIGGTFIKSGLIDEQCELFHTQKYEHLIPPKMNF